MKRERVRMNELDSNMIHLTKQERGCLAPAKAMLDIFSGSYKK